MDVIYRAEDVRRIEHNILGNYAHSLAAIVGSTQSQLKSFGSVIEQAGYRVVVFQDTNALTLAPFASQVTLLACNVDLGRTAILKSYRAVARSPLLILLSDQLALPSDGFGRFESVPHDPRGLKRLLQQRAASASPAHKRHWLRELKHLLRR